MREGWKCPCCNLVHSPDVKECKCQQGAIPKWEPTYPPVFHDPAYPDYGTSSPPFPYPVVTC